MKGLTYGWKKMTGEAFMGLPIYKRQKATVVVFTAGFHPKSWDGRTRKVVEAGKYDTQVSLPEDIDDPTLYIERGFKIFVKVPVKIGRFIP